MNNNNPKVTVLMPVYNGQRYLRQAIESILGQTFTNFEYLIVDDGSVDASRDIVRSYRDSRIKLIENKKNLGVVKALNCGIALAEGDYIARQDADDISHPKRLEKQVAFLNSHPEIALLGTRVNSIDQHGRRSRPYGCCTVSSELAIRWQLMFDNPFVHSSVIMRTGIVRGAGGYNENFLACEDYELFSRLAYSYKATNLQEALLDYRYHSGSVASRCTKENNLIIGDVLRKAFNNSVNSVPDEECIRLWLSINNPYNFKSTANAGQLVKHIQSTYNKFVSIYPAAKEDSEIKKHISHMLLRISYNLALSDRLGSLCCFSRVLKRDAPLACAFLPRYFLSFTLGRHRSSISSNLKKYCGRIKAAGAS